MIALDNMLKKKYTIIPVISITIATGLTFFTLYYTSRRIKKIKNDNEARPNYKEIPSPEGALPYFGHLFQVPTELPALKFDEWHKKYGPLIQIKMGVKPWIVIGDRQIANDILKVRGAATSGRQYHIFLFEYYGLGQRAPAFTYPDKRWKKMRAAVMTAAGTKSVSSRMASIEQESVVISNLLLNGTKEKGHVDVTKYMQLASFNVIMQVCFGKSSKSVDDPLFVAVVDTIDTSVKWGAAAGDIRTFLPAFTKIFNLFMLREKEMIDFTFKKRNPLFQNLIQEALESDQPSFVKHIYQVKEENEFDDDDILVLMVTAGTDTTGMTLAWSFVVLCHHKDVQDRLYHEIASFYAKHNRLPKYKDRENLPLLLSVQKECIRYRSTNHFPVPHESIKDFEYNGYFIPKGTLILSNTYTLNKSPDCYVNPEEFMPERYIQDPTPISVSLNSNVEKRDQYMFGWGRRICPGVHLAEVELFNFWVRIFATSTIEPPLDNDTGLPVYPNLNSIHDAGIVVAPKYPNLRFIERSDRLV
ncbi:cytochrome P450 [Phascolomyces articulosus]|uniref:Cytochrome P450 n=1 Tax=Phascolomyces articulosus TaxID=60185 RepID=A0AAD5K7U7_9FUNG|nr:cytochrome P450 [Phascolomyces articulosus]